MTDIGKTDDLGSKFSSISTWGFMASQARNLFPKCEAATSGDQQLIPIMGQIRESPNTFGIIRGLVGAIHSSVEENNHWANGNYNLYRDMANFYSRSILIGDVNDLAIQLCSARGGQCT